VYARCLVDKKDDAAALGVFKQVLGLDGENIIALRGLAELAERNGRYEEEVDWLSRLLNADPMNGDAAESLAVPREGCVLPPGCHRADAKPDFAVDHETPEPVTLTPRRRRRRPRLTSRTSRIRSASIRMRMRLPRPTDWKYRKTSS